ncbi:outer membrane beta-barrel protein [Haloflavibacter putidus]|uniref:Uncharacterized protein n=1 Tax=Haloflavibacter putidus TaxID=2576776 RepID=A0A507ZNG1_9FLAO|nr:outer membrane beta-barrel protein [Haloflavibacter putidus]TQD38527.1 hypothetical protein FKR84_08900 [Haloflavibacter putidus]
MVKKFFIALLLSMPMLFHGQEIISSPYSYFGIGLKSFKGTAENRSMGGLSIASDSIHMNLQNPAGYGALKLTTYTLGASYSETKVENDEASDKVSNTSIDYLGIGIPAGKLGFGLGLVPYSAVGYELQNESETSLNRFTGRGGLNKLFLAAGYQLNKQFRIGVEGSYNFGNIQNKSLFFQENVQFGTREINRSDLSGFKVNFGVQYEKMLSDKLQLTGSLNYAPATKLTSENTRELAAITVVNDQELVSDTQEVILADTNFDLPSEFGIGAGIGEPKHWFAGLEYQRLGTSNFTNRSFTLDNVRFEDAASYKLGGYYIPDFNDITSYFKRVVYRAGARYQETGLVVNNEAINEFGISFGAGLPAGNMLTNVNLGFEIGKRGTKTANLIEENFFNVFISLSLNDKWFQKRKFN